jgi:hypothetical protein
VEAIISTQSTNSFVGIRYAVTASPPKRARLTALRKKNGRLPIGSGRIQCGESMAELITIPISYFEVIFEYASPNFKLWTDRNSVFTGIFEALKSWGLQIDDVEVLTTGKPSEQGFKFKLPQKRLSFFWGPASCKLTKDDPDWESAEDIIQIVDASITSLIDLSGIVVASQKALIALHLQPKTAPFMNLLGPFVSPQLAALDSGTIKSMAAVIQWENRKLTLDGSGHVANGIFLRFEREFEGAVRFEEIARQLRMDEEDIFAVLGVEEER